MSQPSQDFHEIEAVLRRGWIRPIATPTEFALAADAIAALRRERDQLLLAEEGAKEAFGTIVEQKRQLESESHRRQQTIFAQQEVIATIKGQRDDLLKTMELVAKPVMDSYAGPTRLSDFNAAITKVRRSGL